MDTIIKMDEVTDVQIAAEAIEIGRRPARETARELLEARARIAWARKMFAEFDGQIKTLAAENLRLRREARQA